MRQSDIHERIRHIAACMDGWEGVVRHPENADHADLMFAGSQARIAVHDDVFRDRLIFRAVPPRDENDCATRWRDWGLESVPDTTCALHRTDADIAKQVLRVMCRDYLDRWQVAEQKLAERREYWTRVGEHAQAIAAALGGIVRSRRTIHWYENVDDVCYGDIYISEDGTGDIDATLDAQTMREVVAVLARRLDQIRSAEP